MKKEQTNISLLIKTKACELGFLSCGISSACFLGEEKGRLTTWLRKGMNGEMNYMKNHLEKRLNPTLLVENAKSVVSVLLNYFPAEEQTDKEAPILSKYAYGVDYHFVIKDKLFALFQFIQSEIASCNGRCFVDSAPVLDRAWAVRAGLGWIGKNTNLISPEYGSFFFIGELILDIDLPADEKIVRNHCGNCTRCIDACPTRALVAPYVLDARKCISYQTIENRGEIDPELRGKFANRMFGCDICQDVCPWNLKSEPHTESAFKADTQILNMKREEWYEIDKETFDKLFQKSAVKRAKLEGLKRNLDFLNE